MYCVSRYELKLLVNSEFILGQIRDSCHADDITERVSRLDMYGLYDNGIALLFPFVMSTIRPCFDKKSELMACSVLLYAKGKSVFNRVVGAV